MKIQECIYHLEELKAKWGNQNLEFEVDGNWVPGLMPDNTERCTLEAWGSLELIPVIVVR